MRSIKSSLAVWVLEPIYAALLGFMTRSGLILYCSDEPDTSGINAAALQNAEIGREQLALAREERAAARQRQAEFDPLFKQLVQSSIQQQKTAADQSADQWKSYVETWKPVEGKLAQTATNYDTAERRDSEAAKAAADVGFRANEAEKSLTRDLGRSNLSLSSGKALALAAGNKLDVAKATAGAESQARRQVEQTGISLVDNAARFGRNMPSTGIQTAQLALSAGGQAGSQIGQGQATYSAALAPSQGFYSGAVGATQSAGSLFGNVASLNQQAELANAAFTQDLLGSAIGVGAAAALKSSSKSKNIEGDVDPDAALRSVVETPVKAWRYKDGDGRLRLGPMAEDVAASTGVGDGQTLDVATELGTLRAAVQALAKSDRGGKRLSLSGN